MKKVQWLIMSISSLIFFHSVSMAQCSGVIVEAVPLNPQTGSHNYFGVKVTLAQPYYIDITVNGYIHDQGDPNTNHPFELTVTSGNLTSETSTTFYETDPTAIATVNVISVSTCINEFGLDPYWQNELDSIGIKHNEALEQAFQRLQQENLSSLSESQIVELTATFIAEFYAARYGANFNFSQNDLKSEIINNGIVPESYSSLNFSSQLEHTIDSILIILANLGETASPENFEDGINSILNEVLGSLSIPERLYLTAYRNLITKSFEFWDENIDEWVQLFQNESIASHQNESVLDCTGFTHDDKLFINSPSNLSNSVGQDNPKMSISLMLNNMLRHPCATVITSADGGGLLSGIVRGCIAGALFGSVVGCAAAAIFWGGVQAASSSLGAAISCILLLN